MDCNKLRLFVRFYRKNAGISQKLFVQQINVYGKYFTPNILSQFESGVLDDSRQDEISFYVLKIFEKMGLDNYKCLFKYDTVPKMKITNLYPDVKQRLHDIYSLNNRPSKRELEVLASLFNVAKFRLQRWFYEKRRNARKSNTRFPSIEEMWPENQLPTLKPLLSYPTKIEAEANSPYYKTEVLSSPQSRNTLQYSTLAKLDTPYPIQN